MNAHAHKCTLDASNTVRHSKYEANKPIPVVEGDWTPNGMKFALGDLNGRMIMLGSNASSTTRDGAMGAGGGGGGGSGGGGGRIGRVVAAVVAVAVVAVAAVAGLAVD